MATCIPHAEGRVYFQQWDLLHCCICSIVVLPTLYPKVEVFVDVRERVETIVALPAVTLLLKALDTNAESKAL